MTTGEAFIEAVTGLGDPALLLTTSVVFVAALLLAGNAGAAVAWGLAVTTAVLLTLVAKLVAMTLRFQGYDFLNMGLFSPSGHVSLSLTIYGAFALIAADAFKSCRRSRWLAAAIIMALVIGVTRVLRDDHTISEIVSGAFIGVLCVWLFSYLYGKAGQSAVRPSQIRVAIAVFLCAAVLFEGTDFSPETIIIDAAHQLASR